MKQLLDNPEMSSDLKTVGTV